MNLSDAMAYAPRPNRADIVSQANRYIYAEERNMSSEDDVERDPEPVFSGGFGDYH